MYPLVSIITPTFGREHFLHETLRWFQSQTYPNLEWLVLDDSSAPSPLLAGHVDRRIRYMHLAERLTIGEKRNRLVGMARGEYIAHFDDDDYYAPSYIASMVSKLIEQRADFANLSAWYLYDLRHDFFGFWALKQTVGLHYCCHADRVTLASFTAENNAALATNYMGYGFTYVYRRAVGEGAGFGAVNWCEEASFIDAIRERFKLLHIEDRSGLVLHLLHTGSSSSCFAQYHL
ncbi:MAG TPA: glycosyltransferase family A protein, partial [Pseudomonadota bacterium]|nr:glycosyltransferase family A protein [Pseudomonadota bacterium]